MKARLTFLFAATFSILVFISCNNNEKKGETEMKEPTLKEENVTYNADTVSMNGYVVYDKDKEGPRPAVIVVHEWWGLNDYPKTRARELAKLGYIAMAIDMYGNGKQGNNPDLAGKLAAPFYANPQMAKARFDAALAKLKSYSQADTSKIAAIGYCFGGTQVLNMALLGEHLAGVVSFHGGLQVVTPEKDKVTAKILVCHGLDDQFVPKEEVEQFKKQMDSVGVAYTFKSYEGATHAFTNPASTANGEKFNLPLRYNPAADTASWKDMNAFFKTIF